MDDLDDKIFEQLFDKKESKVISMKSRVLRYASIAAIFIISFFIANQYLTKNSEISAEEAFIWLENNLHSIDTDDLIAYLDDSDFEDLAVINNIIDHGTIDSYLDENDTYILIKESDISLNELN